MGYSKLSKAIQQCGVSNELIKRALGLVEVWDTTKHKEVSSHGNDFL